MNRYFFLAMVTTLVVTLSLAGCTKQEIVRKDEAASPSTASAAAKGGEAETQAEQVATPPVAEAAAGETTKASAAEIPALLTTIYFNYDSSTLSDESRDRLAGHAAYLQKNPSSRLLIEGHCDERGSDEYNLALGEKRARAAWQYLVTMGVPSGRLDVVSYGKEKPADPGHDEGAWSKNRRDEFVIRPLN